MGPFEQRLFTFSVENRKTDHVTNYKLLWEQLPFSCVNNLEKDIYHWPDESKLDVVILCCFTVIIYPSLTWSEPRAFGSKKECKDHMTMPFPLL